MERKTREKRKRLKKSGRNKSRWKRENKRGRKKKNNERNEKRKHASYSSHDSCKSLSEELSNYYRGNHSSYTKYHSQRREKDRRPQEVNISLPYFHGKDNIVAYIDWEIKVEQLFACHHIRGFLKVLGIDTE